MLPLLGIILPVLVVIGLAYWDRPAGQANRQSPLSEGPVVIDYVPARPPRGAAGRFVKSFLILAGLMIAMGLYRGSLPDTPEMGDSASFALVWYFGAFIFGAIALLVAYVRWVRTGHPW